MHPGVSCRAAFLAALLLMGAATAQAGQALGSELWFGGGVHDPDYDRAIAVGRFGGGLVLYEHVSVGVMGQFDRDHWFGFGYAGLILPRLGAVEPYVRVQLGRRDASDEDYLGWSAGLCYGIETVRMCVEVFGIAEPGDDLGVCFGFIF